MKQTATSQEGQPAERRGQQQDHQQQLKQEASHADQQQAATSAGPQEGHMQHVEDQQGQLAAATGQLGGLSLDPAPPATVVVHAFATEPGDHAETPLEAYQHIAPVLERLAKRLGTTKQALRIYDPFFCEGRMVSLMAGLGFEAVYNRNEDFYAMRALGSLPAFDVLVTNPPFSGDHIERTLSFAISCRKPWFLLVPQYVARKAFFLEWVNSRGRDVPRPLFLGPSERPYVFLAPDREDVRAMRAAAEGAASQAEGRGTDGAPPAAGAAMPCSTGEGDTGSLGPEEGQEPASVLTHEGSGQAPAAEAPSTAPVASSSNGHAVQAQSREGVEGSTGSSGSSAVVGGRQAASTSFQVAAGSFQCVWFFHLGEAHQKPVVEWWRKTHADASSYTEAAGGCVVVADVAELPRLTAAPRLTPAERRWRKKQQEAGMEGEAEGQGAGQVQQQRVGGDRAACGRQAQGTGGRPGGSGRQASGGGQQGQGGRPASGAGRPGGAKHQQQQPARGAAVAASMHAPSAAPQTPGQQGREGAVGPNGRAPLPGSGRVSS